VVGREGGMGEMMQESRYYGVAWNYIEDTYRGIGLLADVKKFEDAKEKMFIHNSIEKRPDGTYKIPKVYYRHRVTETEVLMEISDATLQGFELYPEPIVVGLLYSIELDVFKSCMKEKKKDE
jgi:hypothetical protein